MALVGFLMFGFFGFGPNFMAGKFPILDKVGPPLSLVLLLLGSILMIKGLSTTEKR